MVKSIRWLIYLHLIWVIIVPYPAKAQFAFQVEISTPISGSAMQGLVSINGTSAVNDFVSYTLDFSLSNTQVENWFVIKNSSVPIENGLLGEWDTNNLTDGIYRLRLIVARSNGEPVILLVEGLRVRNYTSIETNTPGPSATLLPGQTVTATQTSEAHSPTSLPINSAQLSTRSVRSAFVSGVISVVLIFTLFGIYTTVKRKP